MQTCKNCGEAIYYSLHDDLWKHYDSRTVTCPNWPTQTTKAEPTAGEKDYGTISDWRKAHAK